METIIWKGEPILYKRKGGFGLIVRGLHYWYDDDGRLERMEKLNRTVLNALLDVLNIENRDMVEVAFIEPQKEQENGSERTGDEG